MQMSNLVKSTSKLVTFFTKRHIILKMVFTEDELIKGIQTGSRKVFEYIYEKYGPKVLGYVIKNSGTQADGEDILQRTLTTVWENIVSGKYLNEGKLEAYFYRIATFLWLETLRKRRNAPLKRETNDFVNEIKDTTTQETLADAILKNDQIEAMQAALEQIPTDCKALLKAFHFEDVSLKALAQQSGKEYGTVRKRIFDCREKLKKLMER
jgi:RNA polymerase sigma factor (sigma-70 family)